MVDAAARASGLDIVEIKSYLPAGLTIWIDPREVSCRLTENGPLQVIYRGGVASQGPRRGVAGCDGDEATPDGETQRAGWAYDGHTHELGASRGWSPSGSGASPVHAGQTTTRGVHGPPTTTTCFTAATFAQTKFGSTKMKTQAAPQRPSRLSPVEPLPGAFPSRLSPSSAPLSACWGLSPTGGLSPTANRPSAMQQNAALQLGMMSAGGGDARLGGLHEWILLQHHQQQMQYLAALKQQQQQQRGMASSNHRVPVQASTNTRLHASPHLYDASVRQHLHQLPQLHQPLPPQPAHGSVPSPDVGLFPPLTRDHDVTSGLDPSLKDDGVRLPTGCVDWGLDVAMSGYATGLQQLLLAN